MADYNTHRDNMDTNSQKECAYYMDLHIIQLKFYSHVGSNVSTELLETLFWTSRLYSSISASYVYGSWHGTLSFYSHVISAMIVLQ